MGVLVKNRLVRSVNYESMTSEDGSVTDELVEFYKALAKGGAGLIITGYAYVQANGKGAHHHRSIVCSLALRYLNGALSSSARTNEG